MDWLNNWTFRSKEPLTRDEVAERLQKIEQALQSRSEGDGALNMAAAAVMKALETSEVAVAAQIGSILILKIMGRDGQWEILIRTLTARELTILENNPQLLRDPDTLLRSLHHHPA